MIADTYRHLGRPDRGTDKHLSDLMIRSLTPRWNLPWVLTWLNSERFEPLLPAPLADLTKKTIFLVALASASRVSELHALSVAEGCFQRRSDGLVELLPDPHFLAKNHIPSMRAQSIRIPSLKSSDMSPQARMQDPVRALKIYIRRTKDRRGGRTRLFRPIRSDKDDITAQTISSWLRGVISSAYQEISPQAAKILKVRAHKIRAVSSSLALSRNCASRDIVQAVGWRFESTFARFHLRDLASHRR